MMHRAASVGIVELAMSRKDIADKLGFVEQGAEARASGGERSAGPGGERRMTSRGPPRRGEAGATCLAIESSGAFASRSARQRNGDVDLARTRSAFPLSA